MNTRHPNPARDDIPATHPRRIAKLAWLGERELSYEPPEVRRLCAAYREKVMKAIEKHDDEMAQIRAEQRAEDAECRRQP